MPKRKRQDKALDKKQELVSKDQEEELPDLTHSVLGGLKDPTLNSRLTGTEEDDEGSGISHFSIPFGEKSIVCERHRSPNSTNDDAPPDLIFTHGAGGGIANPATRDFARGFGRKGDVACWQGTMNLENRVKSFHTVVDYLHDDGQVVLGGRSMGARAAVLTALEMQVSPPVALVLVSWPLTAGKEGKREPERREEILKKLPEGVDVLFVVGERDVQCEMGMLENLRGEMRAKSWLVVVEGADHGMSLRRKEGVEGVRLRMGEVAAEWIKERDGAKRFGEVWWDVEKGEVDWSGWKAEN